MKFKKYFFPIFNKILIACLAFLGFSCDDINGGGNVVEYGMPSATYKVHGLITDKSTSSKISNIRVIMNYDTAYSDVNGNYEVSINDFPGDNSYTLYFQDIDSMENGKYLPKDTTIDFTDAQYTGGDGHWYKGTASKEINIKLDPDQN